MATGGTLLQVPEPNPTKLDSGDYWLTDKQWRGIVQLSSFEGFGGLAEEFTNDVKIWEKIWYS